MPWPDDDDVDGVRTSRATKGNEHDWCGSDELLPLEGEVDDEPNRLAGISKLK